MCTDCGCLETGSTSSKTDPSPPSATREISIRKSVLEHNNHIAAHNREHLREHGIRSLNWVSAPGSGKTALLERMIDDLHDQTAITVIVGDQQTDNDARRLRRQGVDALQITTGNACHLDADMVHKALHELSPQDNSLLLIENIGNMVCPTAYDLGEDFKVAVISCPEGEDKPAKYPDLMLASKVLLINKVDLLPYLDFDLDACVEMAKRVNPSLVIFPVSARTGEGLQAFYDWLDHNHVAAKSNDPVAAAL